MIPDGDSNQEACRCPPGEGIIPLIFFMEIFVDADACPVREIIYKEAQTRGVRVTMVVSMAHEIRAQKGVDVLRVDSAFQAVDIAIINRAASGDIVVTSDFGLASIVLGKGAKVISPSGRSYSELLIHTLS